MNIITRASKPEDFADVILLFRQLWPGKALNEEDLRLVFSRGIYSDSDEYLSVELNGKVIGFCSLAIVNNFWQEGQIAYLYAMIVDDAYRGKKVGTELLHMAIAKAGLRGCKKIELDSGFPREKAHKFYEKMGFEKRAYLFSKDL